MRVPGLIDLQVNGYRGVDFSSASLTEEDFTGACRAMLEEGASAFLPTIITSSPAVYERNLPRIASVLQQDEFRGRLLGIHLEGPFLSAADGARGAHDRESIRAADTDYLGRLLDLAEGQVRLLTIAGDIEGAEALTAYAVAKGVAVSLGHHMADAEQLARLAAAGATALTHLGNGLPHLLERHRNPIWAGLACDPLSAMIIPDGHHLPAELIRVIVRAKGVDRCLVTSDAAPLAGLPAGRYHTLGNDVVLAENGRLYNPQTDYLVGSSATMLACMNHLASLDLTGPEDLVRMGFANPLRLIGLAPEEVRPMRTVEYDEAMKRFRIA